MSLQLTVYRTIASETISESIGSCASDALRSSSRYEYCRLAYGTRTAAGPSSSSCPSLRRVWRFRVLAIIVHDRARTTISLRHSGLRLTSVSGGSRELRRCASWKIFRLARGAKRGLSSSRGCPFVRSRGGVDARPNRKHDIAMSLS